MRKIFVFVFLFFQLVNQSTATASQTTSVDVDRQRAISLYHGKKYAEARTLLLNVIKGNKQDHLAWYYLGLIYIQQKKPKDASKAFETALRFRPDFAAGHSGLAYSLFFRNKLSAAVSAAQMALKLDPNLADAYYLIGVARLRTDNEDEALRNAEMALKLAPAFAPAYLLKSQALTSFIGAALLAEENEVADARRDRFAKAAVALEQYLKLAPDASDRPTWEEQLQNLRFYSEEREKHEAEKTVFADKDLTTKARVISKPEPSYTELARGSGITGTVVLRAVFAADGTVKHILVIKGLPDGLTETAVRAARRIKFVPATINGRNVSMFIQLEYNFNLY